MIIRLSFFISGCILGCKQYKHLIINIICGAGGYRWHDGINRGKYVSVRVSGSPEGLSDYIEDRKMGLWYEQFVVDGETYAYMENYDPSGSGNSAVPKGLQDVQRYTLVNKEKNGSLALVWVYTFTNADYEAAKARGAVHITLGEI